MKFLIIKGSFILAFCCFIALLSGCKNEREQSQITLLQKYIDNNFAGSLPEPDGLFFVLIDTAKGAEAVLPAQGDSIFMTISGKLVDNTTSFLSADATKPLIHIFQEYPAIEGWKEGIAKMHSGDSAIIAMPPALAYGKRREGLIPPYSSLIFKVRVLKIIKSNP